MEALFRSVSMKLDKIKSLATPEAMEFVAQTWCTQNQTLESKIASLKEVIQEYELKLGKPEQKAPLKQNPPEPAKSKPNTGGKKPDSQVTEDNVDIGRLDMRVGRIMEVSRHPDADSLYVEKVDLGEGKLRTVVSGLVKFVPMEELQNRIGIFMCNLKPAKMRGVESEAMLMCASAPEAGCVEPLLVDVENPRLGEAVVVPGYNYNPDAQLNPKKKIFEQVKPDLRVTSSGLAGYKGIPWTLQNTPNAVIRAPTLKDVQIA